jgi:glycosyltransferase involved in cell wall biosynthesis
MTPARLCMLVHGPYPVGEPRVQQEADAARAAGFDVDVIALRRAGEPVRMLIEGIDVRRLPLRHRRGGRLRMFFEYSGFALLAAAELARRPRYDVVHVHNPPDFLVFCALSQKVRGAALIFDVHDLSSDLFAARYGSSPAVLHGLRLVEGVAARLADAVVTVHEPYRRELVRRGIPPDRIEVVMNVVDPAVLPERVRNADGRLRIVYNGTITSWYGVESLVEAVASANLPPFELSLVGGGDALPAVLAKAHVLGIGDRVVATREHVPRAEALRVVAGADVAVIANTPNALNRYALPTKLFEYVALGVPVVAPRLETISAHFAENELWFFEPGSTNDLRRALEAAVAHPPEAADRAARAQATLDRHSWSHSRERYLALLSALVEK